MSSEVRIVLGRGMQKRELEGSRDHVWHVMLSMRASHIGKLHCSESLSE